MSEETHHDELDSPETLADELRGLYGFTPRVPAEVDRLIRSDARAQLARRRRWRILLRAGGAGAVAALLLLAVLLNMRQPAPITVASVAGDMNGDGAVNVLDAYVLARRVESGGASPDRSDEREGDMNGDGTVDRRDVDAIGMAAVRLQGPAGAVQ